MSLEQILSQLRVDYLKSIPEKILHIENLWNQHHLELLRTEYHKLKGTGKTYGLPEISTLGEAMEHICDQGEENLALSIKPSLELLKQIHMQRSMGQIFDIEQSAEFQMMQTLLNRGSQKRSG